MFPFKFYLELGFDHIKDLSGYDHILFLIAICVVYILSDWKKILILVTAFTVGHSVSLALATFDILYVPTDIIEFLIPVTILLSASFVFFDRSEVSSKRHHTLKYIAALLFGLIHGLGFSNYLKAILIDEESLLMPLFAFNIGLEIGQILIVFIYLITATIIVKYLKVRRRLYIMVIASAVVGISLIMAIERFPY